LLKSYLFCQLNSARIDFNAHFPFIVDYDLFLYCVIISFIGQLKYLVIHSVAEIAPIN